MICQKHNTLYSRCHCNVLAAVVPSAQVGDVNSTARGSGARYNNGKPDYSLVPLCLVAKSYGDPAGRVGGQAVTALHSLGRWQETGHQSHLYEVLEHLGLNGWDECAKVFDYGRKKYAEWNWAKGMAWSVPTACAARHLKNMIDGLEIDSESGLPHRGHVFSNIVMLLTFSATFPEGDDRPRLLSPESSIKS